MIQEDPEDPKQMYASRFLHILMSGMRQKHIEKNHAYIFYRLSSFPQRTKQTLKSSNKKFLLNVFTFVYVYIYKKRFLPVIDRNQA